MFDSSKKYRYFVCEVYCVNVIFEELVMIRLVIRFYIVSICFTICQINNNFEDVCNK